MMKAVTVDCSKSSRQHWIITFRIAIGKESKMPVLDEPARQDLQEEPSDEFNRLHFRLFRLIAVLRISPPEADAERNFLRPYAAKNQ